MKYYFTGFMGAGKTTVGKEVADILGLPFYDLDQCIELKENKSISDLFESIGESGFRLLEKDHITQFSKNNRAEIIALGGGTMCYNKLHVELLTSGIVIFLDKPWEDIKNSLHELADRPLVQKLQVKELESIYNKRRQFYALSQLTVPVNTGFSPKKVVNLLKLLTNR